MTGPDRSRPPGYRGALATREDQLARGWIAAVTAFFLLILLLSVLGVPSRFIPEPTPIPLPSLVISPTPEASATESAEASAEPSASE